MITGVVELALIAVLGVILMNLFKRKPAAPAAPQPDLAISNPATRAPGM